MDFDALQQENYALQDLIEQQKERIFQQSLRIDSLLYLVGFLRAAEQTAHLLSAGEERFVARILDGELDPFEARAWQP